MRLYKYVQSRIIMFHQHVSITPVTIIRVSYNTKTINIQIILQKIMIKPLDVTLLQLYQASRSYKHKTI